MSLSIDRLWLPGSASQLRPVPHSIVPEYVPVGDAPTPFNAFSPGQREALTELLPDRWLNEHPEHRAEDQQRELEDANQRRR